MRDKCCYPAFMEAPILLPQPVPVTGAPLSRSDQVRLAARARNTQRAYLGHWTRFHSWAQEQGLDLPEGLEAALCDYLVRLAEDGKRMATIRQARAVIIKGADLAGWPKPGGPGVAEMMRDLGRILRGPQLTGVCIGFHIGAWRVTSRSDLGSGQGSGSSHTRLQNRPRCSNHLSQAMPYRITLTVRPGFSRLLR